MIVLEGNECFDLELVWRGYSPWLSASVRVSRRLQSVQGGATEAMTIRFGVHRSMFFVSTRL
jgi:hypothetical protein